MNYAAYLHDGSVKVFPESEMPRVKRAIETGQPVSLEGSIIRGSAIAHVDEYHAKEYGPHTALEAATEVFLEPPKTSGFWQEVIALNKARKEAGKPWLFAQVIHKAKEESGLTEPKDLVEFIDAEWETMGQYNIPNQRTDHEAKRKIKEFFTTEEGRAYGIRFGVRMQNY